MTPRQAWALYLLSLLLAVVGVWAWLHLPELLGWGCS